jgi:cytochrome bd-type quinol oxidase subunit 2
VADRIASSSRRAWVALALGIAAILVMPAAIEVSRRSKAVGLLDTAYAIPLAFVLALVSVVMARRARHNLRWFRVREGGGGTAVAQTAVLVGTLGLLLAVAAALSVGFYGLVVVYQHSR